MEGRGRNCCEEFIKEYREECTDNCAADFGLGTAAGGHTAKYDSDNNVQAYLTEYGCGAVHTAAHGGSKQEAANTKTYARDGEGDNTRSHKVNTVKSCGNLVRADKLVSSTNLGVVEDEPTDEEEYR